MNRVIDFIANNPVLLGVVILVLAIIAFKILKRVAKLALFLVVLGVVAWMVLKWLGKI